MCRCWRAATCFDSDSSISAKPFCVSWNGSKPRSSSSKMSAPSLYESLLRAEPQPESQLLALSCLTCNSSGTAVGSCCCCLGAYASMWPFSRDSPRFELGGGDLLLCCRSYCLKSKTYRRKSRRVKRCNSIPFFTEVNRQVWPSSVN